MASLGEFWYPNPRERLEAKRKWFMLGAEGLVILVLFHCVFVPMVMLDLAADLKVSSQVKLGYMAIVSVVYLGVLLHNRRFFHEYWGKGTGGKVVTFFMAIWLVFPSFYFFFSLPYHFLKKKRKVEVVLNGSQ